MTRTDQTEIRTDETENGRKTTPAHWNRIYSSGVRMCLPSPFVVSTRNVQRLLRQHVRPGMRVLEIGCAPGKYLAWMGKVLGARVTGLDYSEPGMETTRALFRALDLDGDLRCEDVFQSPLPRGAFDVVYSCGVIEHFDDPRDIVERHVSFVAPGGMALIAVPNYAGIYGTLQCHFDPANVDIHNLGIMSREGLRALVPAGGGLEVDAYSFGSLSPYLVAWRNRWPRPLATLVELGLNAVGLLQPVDVSALSPWLVLRIRRKPLIDR